MSIRKDQSKVRKLALLNAIYAGLTDEEKAKHGESFEVAAAKVMGPTWTAANQSMESGIQLEYFLRGAMSVSGHPMANDQNKSLRALAIRCQSFEAAAPSSDWLSGLSPQAPSNESRKLALSRLGLPEESHEVVGSLLTLGGFAALYGGMSLYSYISKTLKKRKDDKARADWENTPLDPKNIDWQSISKIPKYLKDTFSPARVQAAQQVEGQVSGTDIVTKLTWGHEFDDKDPVGFLTKQLAKYEAFYRKHEANVREADKAVQLDEKATRPALMAVKNDSEKAGAVLKDATVKLRTVFQKVCTEYVASKLVLPDHQCALPSSAKQIWCQVQKDPQFKDRPTVRTLTKDEALKIVDILSELVKNMARFTTLFNTPFSDHSDGDPFWDHVEHLPDWDEYTGYIYWQSAERMLYGGIPDISEIIVDLFKGYLTWIDRSLKTTG